MVTCVGISFAGHSLSPFGNAESENMFGVQGQNEKTEHAPAATDNRTHSDNALVDQHAQLFGEHQKEGQEAHFSFGQPQSSGLSSDHTFHEVFTPSAPVDQFHQPVTMQHAMTHTPELLDHTNQTSDSVVQLGQTTDKEDPDQFASEVDTFDKESSGNWVLKRVWWEKIETLYEQIKQVFNTIMTARMDFISQRNRLDRELDLFFGQIGLEEGQLQDMIEDALNTLKKERAQEGFLDKNEEAFYQALQGKQRDIEQLKLDVKALQELDQKVDEALDTLFKQIDIADQYEQKAWETFKDVARELDDKAARKSYYETEALLKDIQNVHRYITQDFAMYFTQTIQSAQTHSKSITVQMQTLKQNGVDLKKRLESIEQELEAKEIAKNVQKEKERAQKEQAKKVQKEPVSSPGIVGSLKVFVLEAASSVVQFIKKCVSYIQSFFTFWGTKAVQKEEKLGKALIVDEKKVGKVVDRGLDAIEKSLDGVESALEKQEEKPALLSDEKKENMWDGGHGQEHVEHPVSVMPQDNATVLSYPVSHFGPPPTAE